MKRILALLVLLTLLPLPALAASPLKNLTVVGSEMSFIYSFDFPEEYAVIKYSTSKESGRITVYSPDGHFAGVGHLQCTYGEDKVKVSIESLKQYNQGKATAALIPVPAPTDPQIPQEEVDSIARKITDLVCEPIVGGIHYRFTAPGHTSLRLSYKTSQQKGQLVLYPGEGYMYEGDLLLPYTYRKSNVFLEILHATRSNLLAEGQTTCGYKLTQQVAEPIPGRLTGVTVCLDAGHQGTSKSVEEPVGPGLSGKKYTELGMAQGRVTRRLESIVVLELAYVIRDELMRQGANVVMTREVEETWLGNLDRAEIAEQGGAHYMLRLHLDSRSNEKSYGIGVYCPRNSDYAKAAAPYETYQAMANALLGSISTSVGYETKGSANFSDKYIGNNWAKMPCFLVELGFMTNAAEDVKVSHPHHQQLLAEGVADGIYEMALIQGLIAE